MYAYVAYLKAKTDNKQCYYVLFISQLKQSVPNFITCLFHSKNCQYTMLLYIVYFAAKMTQHNVLMCCSVQLKPSVFYSWFD